MLAAGRLLGMGRSKAYRLARTGEVPCRVLRIGGRYAVPLRGLRSLLDHTSTDADGRQDRPASEEG
ncbi:unnamed protein product [[Actinomadura] parvosata subsp. kistnae]|nr:unnamed protein product [Actinomadura parvosata subsp. kistnae]